MAFTENWLKNLSCAYNGKNCVTSRLIESGKLPSGKYGISKNLGRDIRFFDETSFQKYALQIQEKKVKEGGLFMPLFINRTNFFSVGGYPEGNVVPDSNIWEPTIAKQGEFCISGDQVLMEKLKKKGIHHQTAFNSVIYHFQEGEKGTKKQLSKYLDPKRYMVKITKILNLT